MLKEGQILENKYKIGRLLGKGGMGAVFLGQNTLIKRTVAIKVLNEIDPESENAKRFEREAQAAGSIGSDHIVEVLDLGNTPDGERFMVMEYLDGESLKTRLSRGRLQPAEVVPLATQILDGLSAAHAAGIVHRDLKPDNIFILKEKAGRRDFVKIVDFGISKFAALEGGMTKTGAVMGTPYYMSPEQARAANEVDNRSDLYSVGVLLFEAVTSSVPFHATTLTELLFKIVFENTPDPRSIVPDLDPAFGAIVHKAMARDANDRYQTAAEFMAALSSWRPAPRAASAPASPASLPLPPPGAEPPPAVVPRGTAAPARGNRGTAILDPSSLALTNQPVTIGVEPPAPAVSMGGDPPQPWAPAPRAPPPTRPFPLRKTAPLPEPALGALVPEATRAPAAPPPKSRVWLVAPAVVVVLGLGAGAAVFLGRPAGGAAGPAATVSATALVTAVVSATAAPATAAPVTATSTPEAPSAAPATTASAAPAATESAALHQPGGAKPRAKPSATLPTSGGKVKDPGY